MDDVQRRFTAYLVRAVKNTIADYSVRRKRCREHIFLADVISAEAVGMTETENDWPENIREWQYFLKDEWQAFLLNRLTRRERDIVFQRIVLEQSFSEIGKACELSESQAKHVYYYAIHKLRRYADGI